MNNSKTYTILPAPILEKLKPFLKENHIEYHLLYGTKIPEDIPERCIWQGHEVHRHLVCIVSNMDPSQLIKTAEELY